MRYDAFKCTVKELTTNSILNVRCLQSFGMCMPSCLLHPSLDLDQVDRFSFMVCCPCHEASFSHFQTPSPSKTDIFRCDSYLFVFPFFVGAHRWVLLLCQPWGVIHFITWLPKVKAPGYFRHTISI